MRRDNGSATTGDEHAQLFRTLVQRLAIHDPFASALLLGLSLIGLLSGPRGEPLWLATMVAMPLLILGVSMLFLVRGYELSGNRLLVRRLFWTTVVELDGLQAAYADPEAMKHSLRTFGNGGLFCFAGRFRNKRLGAYRAWATDPSQAVVLDFGEKRVVVTPDRPGSLVDALAEKAGPATERRPD